MTMIPPTRPIVAPVFIQAAPSLIPGDCAAPACRRVESERSRRCELLFVTDYSSDFSPINQVCSTIKALRRGLVVPMCEALLEAVAMAVCAITPYDALAWFAHARYSL